MKFDYLITILIAKYGSDELKNTLAVLGTPILGYICFILIRDKVRDIRKPKLSLQQATQNILISLQVQSGHIAKQISDTFNDIYKNNPDFKKPNMEIDLLLVLIALMLNDTKKHFSDTDLATVKQIVISYISNYENGSLYGDNLSKEQKDLCYKHIVENLKGYISYANSKDDENDRITLLVQKLFTYWNFENLMPKSSYDINVDLVISIIKWANSQDEWNKIQEEYKIIGARVH